MSSSKEVNTRYRRSAKGRRNRRRWKNTPGGVTARKRWKASATAKKLKAESRRAMVAFVRELKRAPCTDCGLTFDPICMDFDHIDRTAKRANVSRMSNLGLPSVMAEIAKCELVCANCHRLRTKDQNIVVRPRVPEKQLKLPGVEP